MLHNLPFIPMALICAFIAFLTATFTNPVVIKLAYKKNLTDNPGHRKLQKKPVPVIGGVSVYIAFIIGLFFCNYFYPTDNLYVVIAGMTVMFFVGFLDDLIDMSYKAKFLFQIGVIFTLWAFGYRIDTFAGLFGLHQLPMWVGGILSIIAGVGLMNAINMIDGVDGLASGLGILSCIVCAFYFVSHGDPLFALVAMIFVGALIPFFICNVFSHKYKMFMGDSGSLILGTLAYIFTCRILHDPVLDWNDQYTVAMLLGIYALPVFDTLRVMLVRMLHGINPFKPDRTHLHHIFVELGFPHFMISFILLVINAFIIGVWYITSLYMNSINGQFFVVLATSVILIGGTYGSLRFVKKHYPLRFETYMRHARRISKGPLKIYHAICDVFDGKSYRRWKMKRK